VSSSYSSEAPESEATGTLASDEALAALREKLTGES
jgi:small subunit ribosomal protein S1